MDNSLHDVVMRHDKIYSLMYQTRADHRTLEDQIIEVDTSKLDWSRDKQTFYYVWGYPGPDYNKYTAENYGQNWAFTKQDILDAWRNEQRQESSDVHPLGNSDRKSMRRV